MLLIKDIPTSEFNFTYNSSDVQTMDESSQFPTRTCDSGLSEECGLNEECVPSKTTETNICTCLAGFQRNSANICVLINGKILVIQLFFLYLPENKTVLL